MGFDTDEEAFAACGRKEDTTEGIVAASRQEVNVRSCAAGSPCMLERACWEELRCNSLAVSAVAPWVAAHGALLANGGSSRQGAQGRVASAVYPHALP